ncbi:acyl-CoA dehydrogenase family protein [Mycolicibacterium aichiense]|uniref:Acyl-CoA dehydrogenase n=1 Tax=Mycolicibacterium aichiense TaxID=1799 RepID=A0AAD1MFE3_9MYCO|nr:acyl-CoA dehydrogenase family protein [Mycolicibacterium aichiense]MCV7017043.1 acyl-CoA dehydrogenase [Mycolicibacterium aichiense]BBX10530.1 acyl-CoA dehydrogenase [Mycolicibacterium aichiense]STZ25812.1 acyl-CoA dehydrogenase [Mycolicibacterium aichiense]
MTSALTGGVFVTTSGTDELADLRQLADDIGVRSFDERIGRRGLPDDFDSVAWKNLQDAGLTRLTSDPESGGGPTESAVVLRALARHAVTVPLAETDVLAAWLAAKAGLAVPDRGPLTIAIGNTGARTVSGVPYAGAAGAVVVALRDGAALAVAITDPATVETGHNLGGEPRDTIAVPGDGLVTLDGAAEELARRGAWVRCIQALGALDAAVEFSVAHTREREQFGRPLSAFQAVQHTLASMAGEVERARAATELAVAAVAVHGFDSAQADYAVTVAKVVLGRVVPTVVTAAHQLHGAIGVTIEHRLWLATMRARSWIDEFGDTAWHARKLGRMALTAGDPWDFVVGAV